MLLFIDNPMPVSFIEQLEYIGEAKVAIGGHPGSLYKAVTIPESDNLSFLPVDLFHKGVLVYGFAVKRVKGGIAHE